MTRKIEFASHPANLSLLRSFIRQFLTRCAVPETDADLMILGVDEACSNIIRHAYREQQTQLITCSCEKLENGVRFRLRDFGAQRDLHRVNVRPLEAVQPGGLGLHLIRKAFDQVDYNLKRRGTELILTKRVGAAG